MVQWRRSMFFLHRAAQVECLDAPDRPDSELCDGYHWLAKVNHLTRFSRPFEVWLPRELGEDACRRLTLLDVGAGDGLLGRCLEQWAAARGWDWQVTNLDFNPRALALNPGGRNVVGSAAALPFPDDAFDVVIASQMTHHLETEADVVRHFAEAHRVARRAALICDMHRNVFFYALLAATLTAMRLPAWLRQDGMVSVKRGWRVPEWRAFAQRAGLPHSRVWFEHGTRVLLCSRKAPVGAVEKSGLRA
jgi:SAM-dependent methyltransferase